MGWWWVGGEEVTQNILTTVKWSYYKLSVDEELVSNIIYCCWGFRSLRWDHKNIWSSPEYLQIQELFMQKNPLTSVYERLLYIILIYYILLFQILTQTSRVEARSLRLWKLFVAVAAVVSEAQSGSWRRSEWRVTIVTSDQERVNSRELRAERSKSRSSLRSVHTVHSVLTSHGIVQN